MTHRADQIVDQVVSLLPASLAAVLKNRSLPISEAEQEVPAFSVCMGDDAPLDDIGRSNFSFIDSLLTVDIISLVREQHEPAAVAKLTELRTAAHIALMADDTLGLAFVIGVRYAGAPAPELEQTDLMAGRQVARWLVHYRMNVTDPQ
jgi:hypothetical protein